jgi:hypothetical protein
LAARSSWTEGSAVRGVGLPTASETFQGQLDWTHVLELPLCVLRLFVWTCWQGGAGNQARQSDGVRTTRTALTTVTAQAHIAVTTKTHAPGPRASPFSRRRFPAIAPERRCAPHQTSPAPTPMRTTTTQAAAQDWVTRRTRVVRSAPPARPRHAAAGYRGCGGVAPYPSPGIPRGGAVQSRRRRRPRGLDAAAVLPHRWVLHQGGRRRFV